MTQHYDVIVAGGGSGGVAAAIGASRAGARTLLIERGPCLGGAATLRNVVTYCGLYTRDDQQQAVFGVADEVITALRGMGAISDPTRFTAVAAVFDPESVKRVADELCAQAGVDVLLHTHVLGADREGDQVTAVRVADHSGIHEFTAKAFVDATGEADLAHHAGAEVRYGNDGWVQNGTLGVRFGGIPANAEVTREAIGAAVRAAKKAGAPGLTAESGLIARMPISGDLITYLADEGYDARSAADTTRAEIGARRQAQAYLQVVRSLPGCDEAYIVSTGPEMGTRESRHLVGRYRFTEKEVLQPGPVDDAVAIGAWPIEYHPGPGIPSEWRFIGDPGFYGIPLDVLHSRDTPNLFAAGRTVDGDRGAGASLRAMGTAFATGHAAGVAAAFTAAGGDADTAAVRAELNRQGARLPE
ncbi:FAD dependent oxidoreductase [Saccharopolyspora shandongensis]|uniref:FAD dependent oxidoreductase n=1 Tax=Saccharopolyspora shandongensis TaxID=418495 RepID=A0A1H3K3I6_9PSEU|nr:FAD-dependent oxidoreductase [Saccharopolyspora shandongensis]SDY46746.1 FAD dependent oxidoreductase [Saccharopolyspora shandongensis]